MKKLAIAFITAVSVLCLSALAFAGSLAPGASVTCNNAKSIKIESAGKSAGDRENANLVIWKSANLTTIPISVGPTDLQGFKAGGAAGDSKSSKFKCKDTTQCVPGAIDNSPVNMSSKFSMGRKSVTLSSQTNFSRGDSIGDISGEVRITNTGSVPGNVTCG